MSYKYNPYRDTFEHIPDEQPTTVNFPPVQYKIVKQIDLTQDNIEQIADAVVRKLKDVSVTNVGNIPIEAEGGRVMRGCVYRTSDNQCQKYSDPLRNTMSWCVGDEPCESRTFTNADRIRLMSDEELASFLYHSWDNSSWCNGCCDEECSCEPCWLDWLKQEVDDDTDRE